MAPALTHAAVEVTDLRYRYGTRVALDGVSLRVEAGELVGLLGPNGSGKSTLFAVLATLRRPESGRALVLGHDVAREPAAVRRALGVVFQHPSVDPLLGVEENLIHHGHLHGLKGAELRARAEHALVRLGLADRRRERVERLSGGLRRRVELAKALVAGARVLLLDEPGTGLDPAARRDFMAALEDLRATDGTSVLLTTHDMEEAERCDRVAFLDDGRLAAAGTPHALRAALGRDVLVLRTALPEALREQVHARFGLEARLVDGTVRLECARAHELVRDLVEAFPEAVQGVTYGKPTLEDVFLHLTGHRLSSAA